MPRLTDLQTRVTSLLQLTEVVSAMRSLSAARVQQAHDRISSIRQYTSVVEGALGDVLSGLAVPPELVPNETTGPGAVIVFGSEHGFVGAFNDRLLERAVPELRGTEEQLYVVGSRALIAARERALSVAWSSPSASHVGGISDVGLRVAEHISAVVTDRDLQRVVLVYARGSVGTTWRVVTETLLPFDVRPFRPRHQRRPSPLSNLSAKPLLNALVDELVFAQLNHVAAESFASENISRLAAMESAHDNVGRKLDELQRLESTLRQEEITTELLDIVTGAEAMNSGRSHPR